MTRVTPLIWVAGILKSLISIDGFADTQFAIEITEDGGDVEGVNEDE